MSPCTRCLLSLLLLVHVCLAQDDSPPPTPCPAVYGYGWNPVTGWHGQISIVPPPQFSEVRLVIRLSLPYYHPEAGVGHVEIKGGNDAVQQISNKAFRGEAQTIRYLVIFPPFKQLPRIISVNINGKEFCPAQQMYPDTRGTIELKYSLKTGLNLQTVDGSFFSVASVSEPLQPTRPTQPTRPAQPSQPARPVGTDLLVIAIGIHENGAHPIIIDTSYQESGNHQAHTTNISSIKPSTDTDPDAIVFLENITHPSGPNPNRPTYGSSESRPPSRPNPPPKRPNSPTNRPNSPTNRPNLSPGPETMNMEGLDERIIAMLSAISKGETVASTRVEKLLERLIFLTSKRYHTEMERRNIEKERLEIEVAALKSVGL